MKLNQMYESLQTIEVTMQDKIKMYFLTHYPIKMSLCMVFVSMVLIIVASACHSNVYNILAVVLYIISLYLVNKSGLYYTTDEYSFLKLKYIIDNLDYTDIIKTENDYYISFSGDLFALIYYKQTNTAFCKTDNRYSFNYLSEVDSFKLLNELKMMD